MYTKEFAVSVIDAQAGKVIQDEGNGVVKMSPNTTYVIRVRNKHRLRCLADVIVDGVSVTNAGRLALNGDDYVDLLGFIDGERFKYVKGKQSIEVNFYLEKEEKGNDDHGIAKKPIMIQEKIGEPLKSFWYPQSYYIFMQESKQKISGGNLEVITVGGSVNVNSVIDDTNDVSGLISAGAITSTADFFSPTSSAFHNAKFEVEVVQLKLIIKSK